MLSRETLDQTVKISTRILTPILKNTGKSIKQITTEAREKCPFTDNKRRNIYNTLLLKRLHNRTPATKKVTQEELF